MRNLKCNGIRETLVGISIAVLVFEKARRTIICNLYLFCIVLCWRAYNLAALAFRVPFLALMHESPGFSTTGRNNLTDKLLRNWKQINNFLPNTSLQNYDHFLFPDIQLVASF